MTDWIYWNYRNLFRKRGYTIVNYYEDKTTEEYKEELQHIFDDVNDYHKLQYFYIFITEKLKRMS